MSCFDLDGIYSPRRRDPKVARSVQARARILELFQETVGELPATSRISFWCALRFSHPIRGNVFRNLLESLELWSRRRLRWWPVRRNPSLRTLAKDLRAAFDAQDDAVASLYESDYWAYAGTRKRGTKILTFKEWWKANRERMLSS